MPSDPIRKESSILIAAAKSAGCYVEAKDIQGTRYSIRSGESEVFYVQSDHVFNKLKNPFAKSHLKKHSERFAIYEHIIHNMLFPSCPIEFVGVAEVIHEARLVYRQKAVRSSLRPDDRSIVDFLARMGLLPAERYCFGNSHLFVTDVGQDSDNVLQDGEGRLFFIDPIIGFREPLCARLDDLSYEECDVQRLVYAVLGENERKTK